jgi:Leucine-rich repeat (LRR) protein
LPWGISRLSALIFLDLENNSLGALPTDIKRLTLLRTLKIANNKLCVIPDSIASWINQLDPAWRASQDCDSLVKYAADTLAVRMLLDSNGQKKVTVISVARIQSGRVVTLNVSNRGIYRVPDNFSVLTALDTLILSGNRLDSLPAAIGVFRGLKALWADRDSFTFLPPEIGNLLARTNTLGQLPPSIGRLQSLRSLDLYGNQLVQLPDSIGNLSTLTWLDLNRNGLAGLPVSITRLAPVNHLNLDSNCLGIMADSIHAWLDIYNPGWDQRQTCITGIPASPPEKPRFSLEQNSPNPFNPVTVIRYQLPVPGLVNLQVYNTQGRLVKTLVDEVQSAGRHAHSWSADRGPAGVILFKLSLGKMSAVRKGLLLK